MNALALEGGFADPPLDAAACFRAALQAMARPGSVHRVDAASPPAPLSTAAGALALTLCDPDTPVWLSPSLATPEVRDWISFHTGAPLTTPEAARFAFGTWAEMPPLTTFAQGEPDYPDRSATLILERPELGEDHRLTGPGIQTEARLTAPDPDAFRANASLFPLGLDFYFTCGDQIAALPRSTRIGD